MDTTRTVSSSYNQNINCSKKIKTGQANDEYVKPESEDESKNNFESEIKSEDESKNNYETVAAVDKKVDKIEKTHMTEQEKAFLEQLSIALGTYEHPEDQVTDNGYEGKPNSETIIDLINVFIYQDSITSLP